MTDYVFNPSNPLPASGVSARLELAGPGTTLINLEVGSATLTAVQASDTQRILIGASGSVLGQIHGLELQGAASGVYNEGAIRSATSTAILFSGGGTSSVTNLGSIEGVTGVAISSTQTTATLHLLNAGVITTSGTAVIGGLGADRIINTGTIGLTAAIPGMPLLDLRDGDDFYDGVLGTATGGTIELGTGNDKAFGGAGAESFSGGDGDDSIDGGGGDDTIHGGSGNDTMIGGAGIDTVDYSDYFAHLSIDLRKTTPQSIDVGLSHKDILLEIENVIGGLSHDNLTGNDSNNTLVGGKGDDTLDGGLGDDRLEGGEGSDTVRYSGYQGVNITLGVETGQTNTGYGTDILIGIENLEGSTGSDTLAGSAEDNKLYGSSGNDLLNGNGGNDTLDGGIGDDTMTGGAGNDSLDGGTGRNTAVFSGAEGDYTITTVTVDAATTVTVVDNRTTADNDGTDTLKNIRFLKFLNGTPDTTSDDVTIALTNSGPTNVFLTKSSILESTAAGTTVASLFGSDPDGDPLTYTLVDGGGRFTLSGTNLVLSNALDFETATSHSITVRAQDAYGGVLTKAITINVQNVVEATPIVKKGTAANEHILGENGNDRLYGAAGNDTVWGGNGNDVLYGGTGNDYLIGQGGKDIFVLDTKPNRKKNIDWIYDFNVKDDTIHLSKKIFSKIAKKGALSKKAFVVGNAVKDKDDRIIYLKKDGALFYDPDGTGNAKAVQIATIEKNLKLTHKDFFII